MNSPLLFRRLYVATFSLPWVWTLIYTKTPWRTNARKIRRIRRVEQFAWGCEIRGGFMGAVVGGWVGVAKLICQG